MPQECNDQRLPRLPGNFVHDTVRWGKPDVFPFASWRYMAMATEHQPVFIGCPWATWTDRPDQERHLKRDYAKALGRWALTQHLSPVVPVLQSELLGLRDEVAEDRQVGVASSMALLGKLGHLIVGIDGGVTAGMEREIEFALEHHRIAWWISLPGWAQQFRQFGCAVDWS